MSRQKKTELQRQLDRLTKMEEAKVSYIEKDGTALVSVTIEGDTAMWSMQVSGETVEYVPIADFDWHKFYRLPIICKDSCPLPRLNSTFRKHLREIAKSGKWAVTLRTRTEAENKVMYALREEAAEIIGVDSAWSPAYQWCYNYDREIEPSRDHLRVYMAVGVNGRFESSDGLTVDAALDMMRAIKRAAEILNEHPEMKEAGLTFRHRIGNTWNVKSHASADELSD